MRDMLVDFNKFRTLVIFSYASNKKFHSNFSVEIRVDARKQTDGHERFWLLFRPCQRIYKCMKQPR